MAKWASVVGLTLTAAGVLIAFYLPQFGAYYGRSNQSDRRQFLLRFRVTTGAALVIVGTLLQICGAWLM